MGVGGSWLNECASPRKSDFSVAALVITSLRNVRLGCKTREVATDCPAFIRALSKPASWRSAATKPPSCAHRTNNTTASLASISPVYFTATLAVTEGTLEAGRLLVLVLVIRDPSALPPSFYEMSVA
jgi:hypothetical protein